VRCATDVTGFGLLGHASHIARASNVQLSLDVGRVPSLLGARDAWNAGVRTGGAERNDEYLQNLVAWGETTDADRALLIDPQTSGGLLLALSPDRLADYLSRVPGAIDIGDVRPPSDRAVALQ
jgi:selenide,water dikinase